MKQYTFKDGSKVIASSREEAIEKHKATAVFRPDEKERLNKCLALLEKQCEICGLKLYFDFDAEKEYVNVYLKPDKKYVYLSINVGSDSTATAMYDIWKVIHSKI
jgi:hypothetical protein